MDKSNKLDNEIQTICQDAAEEIKMDNLDLQGDDQTRRKIIIDQLIQVLTTQRDDNDGGDGDITKRVKPNNENDTRFGCVSTPLNLTSERQALSNPLILTKILKNLDGSNLKHCRLINSAWNDLSTHVLNNLGHLQLSFKFDIKYNAYFLQLENQLTSTTLNTISDTIELAQTKFPCQSFYFTNGLYETPSFDRFLHLYGLTLKSLKLNFSAAAQRPQKLLLRKLLFHSMPNLETLNFVSLPSTWHRLYSQEKWTNRNLLLPQLKYLIINCNILNGHENLISIFHLIRTGSRAMRQPVTFWRQIFQAGINLKKISSGQDIEENFLTVQLAQSAIQEGKSHLIKELQFPISSSENEAFEIIEDSNSPELNLEKLILRKSDNLFEVLSLDRMFRHPVALNKILESSCDSLTLLKIVGLVQVDLPPMSQLTTLSLKWDQCHGRNPNAIPIIQNDFNTTELPNLKQLTLDFGAVEISRRNIWAQFVSVFPFIQQTNCVRHLKIVSLPEPEWLEQFGRKFPFLTKLTLEMIKTFSLVGKKIWIYFPRLRQLNLDILVGAGRSQNLFPQLEATFTGFSQAICRKLKDDPESVVNIERWRKFPSILNLQRLRELNVTFSHVDRRDPTTVNKLLSHVTGHFAFNLMPRLHTKIIGIGYEPNAFVQALDSISPYAQIVPPTDPVRHYEIIRVHAF